MCLWNERVVRIASQPSMILFNREKIQIPIFFNIIESNILISFSWHTLVSVLFYALMVQEKPISSLYLLKRFINKLLPIEKNT